MPAYPKTDTTRKKGPAYIAVQEAALKRDEGLCLVCGKPAHKEPHHIKYKSEGGGDVVENVGSLCYDCHNLIHHKGLRELIEKATQVWGLKKVVQHILRGIIHR